MKRITTSIFFEVIQPGNFSSFIPDIITFPAYIENLSDAHAPQWNSENEMGRPDARYLYSQWNRSINMAFKIVSSNEVTYTAMISGLNKLLSSTYPVYGKRWKQTDGYNGNFIKMTIPPMIRATGIIQNLSWNLDANTPYAGAPGAQLPLVISVDLDMIVIGDIRPEYKQYPGPLGLYPYFPPGSPQQIT